MKPRLYLQRTFPFMLSLGVGLLLLGAVLLLAAGPTAAAQPGQPLAPDCYATADGGATTFHTADAEALRQAIAAATGGDSIWVAGTCAGVITEDGTSQVALITETLTLRGGYTVTNSSWSYNPAQYQTWLDAQNQGRVLLVQNAGTVTLVDLTLLNGQMEGGANGGAIAAFDSALTLTRTQMMSNTASGSGGAIYVEGMLEAYEAGFEANHSGGGGGAVRLGSQAVISDSRFQVNEAGGLGGAINSFSGLTVINSEFLTNSTSGRRGGAIYVQGAGNDLLWLNGDLFQGNRCTDSSGCFGGAVAAANPVAVVDSWFVQNSTSGSGFESGGGAIYALDNLDISSSNFFSNTTPAHGGALHVLGPLSLESVLFYGNQAGQDGGAIRNSGEMTMGNSELVGNHAGGSRGGGIYNRGTISMSNSLLSGNSASASGSSAGEGGGIYNASGSHLIVAGNVDFEDNVVTGGFGVGGGIANDGTAAVSDSRFTGNDGDNRGGAIANGGVLTATNLTITENVARNGGGIGHGGGQSFILNTVFEFNRATGVQTKFESPGGGGLSVGSGNVTVADSRFYSNTAVYRGGGIYQSGIFGSLDLVENLILDNRAEFGGGLYVRGRTSVERSYLFENVADWGGAAGMDGRATVEMTNNFIAANQAAEEAQVFYLGDSDDQPGSVDLIHDTVVALQPENGSTAIATSGERAGYEIGLTNVIISGFNTGVLARGVTDTVDIDGVLWYQVLTPTAGITANVGHSYRGQPAFVDPAAYDFHLLPSSAAIDRGVPTDVDIDIEEEVRPQGAAPDLGADETPYEVPGLGDLVWWDLNGDGIQQLDEPGVGGVTVTLLDAGDTVITSTVTDDNGFYLLRNLPAGDYRLEFELPAGYKFTTQNAGSDEALDSDADPETGRTALISLGDEETDLTWDAGLVSFVPDLTLEKLISQQTAAPGETFRYTLEFSNQGAAEAEDVVLTDSFPDDVLELLSWEAEDAVVTATEGVSYSWDIENLPPGTGGRLILLVRLRSTVTQNLVINRARIDASVDETNEANNSDSVLLTVEEAGMMYKLYLPIVVKNLE